MSAVGVGGRSQREGPAGHMSRKLSGVAGAEGPRDRDQAAIALAGSRISGRRLCGAPSHLCARRATVRLSGFA